MEKHNFILLRGLARESGHWGPFLELIKDSPHVHKVYPLDLPGAGAYHKISSPLSIGGIAEFLVAKIKELDEKEPFVVVSISLGSMVAIEMAHRYPELFKKVFLMNTSVSNLSPVHHRMQLQAIKRMYRILRSKENLERETEVLKMVSNDSSHWDKTAQVWADIAEQRPVSPLNFLKQLLAASRYQLPELKPSPEMIMFCSRQDPMVHYSCSEKIAKHWNLPIFYNPTAGHELALDDPQWVLETIEKNLM